MPVLQEPPAAAPSGGTGAPRPAGILPRGWAYTALAVGVLALSAIFTVGTLPGVEICWFKAVTGLSCPGCGLTRAFCSISHGQLAAAWGYNPFSFLFYPAVVAMVFWPWIGRSARVKALLARPLVATWLPLATVAAMWAYGLVRMLRE